MKEPPTLTEALAKFRQPLVLSGVLASEMELAGESLTFDLGGEGSIQQGGIEYWPYFCQSDFKSGVTFPREASQLAKEKAVKQLPQILWSKRAEMHFSLIHAALKQSYFCNIAGQSMLPESKSKEIFVEALNALKEKTLLTNAQWDELTEMLENHVPEIAKYAGGSVNKDALKLRFQGFLVFKHLLPNVEGLRVLRSLYVEPIKKKSAKKTDSGEKKNAEARFLALGDDPIKLVRGKASIVFRAFTALPLWKPKEISDKLYERSAFYHEIVTGESHQYSWKLFDVAAFKEALKVYNQFQQNLVKREDKLNDFATKLLVMDGDRAMEAYGDESTKALRERLETIWKAAKGKVQPSKNDTGEESVTIRFAEDTRIDRLRQIVNDDLAEEYRLTDGKSTAYGLRRRTIKGWGEVKRRWQTIVRKGVAFSIPKRDELKAELDKLRSGEKRDQIGSHKLFESLIVDDQAWSIWREPDDQLQEQILKNQWAADPLEAFREFCELREAMEEVSARPLNFTPADSRYSRRLFSFTDTCSFGKDAGEYKHDLRQQAVTVPVAVRLADGRFTVQACLVSYSAPRLLRDQIRGEDGSYVQDWMQPMMRALFGEGEGKMNPQKLKDSAVQLMPDYAGGNSKRVLLNFPLDLDESKIQSLIGKATIWQKQFVSWKKGAQLPFMRWTGDFDEKDSGGWWKKVSTFRVLAADLGTRHAASIALVECGKEKGGTTRFIGNDGGSDWFGRYRSGKILRLPGENALILRPESPLDQGAKGKTFREELYGERGRSADDAELVEVLTMLNILGQSDLVEGVSEMVELRRRFSFPELNDKLLVAMRRAQGWVANCISWHWKLTQPDSEDQRANALEQLREQDRMPTWQSLADGTEANLVALRDTLHVYISLQRENIQKQLLKLTARILPLRGRGWEWVIHTEKADCHILRQTADGTGPENVKLRGQRGLSMARVEQLSELRRRWQSLNQSLRRQIGSKPLTASEMRNDPIPDPCPDILTKLENIREQRVNQTAHLILAEALGLKLRVPQMSAESRRATDTHGEYEVSRPPVDFIVLEDLSRYLSDQGRARSENTRLMKWCHRAVMQKVKMLAEPFGIPVLETPAAYSSRFCSLTGASGFRAVEVSWADRSNFRWAQLLKISLPLLEQEIEKASANKAKLEELRRRREAVQFANYIFSRLEKVSRSKQPHCTLLAPQPGGPMFVTAREVQHPAPAANRKQQGNTGVLPMQADLNAAANLALRAVAHPNCAHIHHRLRTERKKGAINQPDTFLAREPRRFGNEKVAIIPKGANDLPKERNTNMFYDEVGVATFGRARLESDQGSSFPYASGPSLWAKVNDRELQWARCMEINQARIQRWEEDGDEIPM
ncbi:MAG: type V CRISPR-associated protein Cas12b [Verrucomicrobiota bacterium]